MKHIKTIWDLQKIQIWRRETYLNQKGPFDEFIEFTNVNKSYFQLNRDTQNTFLLVV